MSTPSSVAEKVEKQNKFEKYKAEKDGLAVKDELGKFAEMGWEAVDKTDLTGRLKWLGVFYREVTPGKFMLRLRMPNGVISAEQMRVLAEIVQRYGDDGCADITTRQNLQLRGVRLEDIPDIFERFKQSDLTSMQSGMDNVRNITGSPVAGIAVNELLDTQVMVRKVQDMITNSGEGNADFTNLPRKFNIAIEGTREDSIHSEINDIAFIPAFKEGVEGGELGFNVLVGGFFSAQRCDSAIPLNAWVPADDDIVVAVCRAILSVFRDRGSRGKRQQTRLMWLIEAMGLEAFRAAVEVEMGADLAPAAPADAITEEGKSDHLGVHPQKQAGLNYVGLHVPVGHFYADDMFEFARLSEVYGNGEIRLTVEQNVIIPNIPEARLAAFLQEEPVQKFSPDPSTLVRSTVSCTGSRFCNFALIETKQRAHALSQQLDELLSVPESVRLHWTGCPNSCGQPQVADIGFLGTKARKDGKPVEAVDIYMGGKVGKHAQLGERVMKAVPCEDLPAVVSELLKEKFGAIAR